LLYDGNKSKKSIKSPLESWVKKYVSKESAEGENKKWWLDEEETNEDYFSDFLNDKQKISQAIPSDFDNKDRSYPDKLADFKTEYGVISVGADKGKADKELVMTIFPSSKVNKAHADETDPFDKNTYFGDVDEKLDDFRMSDLSFKYDLKHDKIDRIDKDDADGVVDEEYELLYQDETEESRIEDLVEEKNDSLKPDLKLEKKLKETRDLKEKKKKENMKFFEEIRKIVFAIKKGKIKKIVESEDAIVRKNRIHGEFENYLLIEQLRFLLKKIKEKGLEESQIQEIESVDLKLLTEEQLKKIIGILQVVEKRSEN